MKFVEDEAGPSMAAPDEDCFDFDVFISFRGEDTRNGFTSHLHKEFIYRGINAFIDSEDLKKGDRISDLLNHIDASKIFVPVFSKNYAESTWCLREIAKMVEINKREGEKRPIIPIFYDVDPSHVRHCRESFDEAFEKHQKDEKFGEELISGWKTSLEEAGNISGYCLSQTGRNEAALTTLISKQVSRMLCKVQFDIEPIGLDSRVDYLKKMLEREKDDVCVIGICGLGGIGKTTAAKALYNDLSLAFEYSFFLSDVSENEKKEGLPSLQAKFMNKVLREKLSIGDVNEGVALMKQRLGNKKVLLVLDDVDGTHQLEAFIAKHRNEKGGTFGAGSKIIVTTRDEAVLGRHGLGKSDIYNLKRLDAGHSLRLFCRHAFGSDQPLAAFRDLSQEVVKVAKGLPLALIVFGSLFYDLKKKEDWEEKLRELKRDRGKDVHERLKISYDSLDHKEKCVFLDIACFFVGESKEFPVYMWEACDYSPRFTLKVLQHKSLVEIDGGGRFRMHDEVRDMGRMIVEKEADHKPLEYSRLWSEDDIKQVLSRNENVGVENPHLQGLYFPAFGGKRVKMGWKRMAAMPSLRMIVGGVDDAINEFIIQARGHFETITPTFILKAMRGYTRFYYQNIAPAIPFHRILQCEDIRLPPNLRWLSWTFYPSEMLTFRGNRHEQLCILDLSWGQFLYLEPHKLKFPKLKVLDLSQCKKLQRTPDFTHFVSLEVLRLHGCKQLTEMDESIGCLHKLVTLNMRECSKLKKLPAGIWNLTSLEYFDLSHCQKIRCLPAGIGDLRSLKSLRISCTSFSELPDSIGRLQYSLEELDLSGCLHLKTIPPALTSLPGLCSPGL